jgi:hypothetical protein
MQHSSRVAISQGTTEEILHIRNKNIGAVTIGKAIGKS